MCLVVTPIAGADMGVRLGGCSPDYNPKFLEVGFPQPMKTPDV